MSQSIITNQTVYFGGYDLTSRTNAIALDYSAELQDNTTLGMLARSRIGGLKNLKVQVEGYIEIDTTDKALFDKVGVADLPMSFGINGDASGDPAYTMLMNTGELVSGGKVGELYAYSIGAESNSPLVRGTVMVNSKAAPLTVTATGTARQLGAISATQKMYAALHVLTVGTGSPTLDVVIKSDATNAFAGSETSRITFTQATSIGAEMKTLTGAITNTWWKPYLTIGGSSPSFKAILVIGII